MAASGPSLTAMISGRWMVLWCLSCLAALTPARSFADAGIVGVATGAQQKTKDSSGSSVNTDGLLGYGVGLLKEFRAKGAPDGYELVAGERRVLYYWHSLANHLLTTICNIVSDLNLTDMETCYKAIRGEVARGLTLTSDRFGFEPEVTAQLAKAGARIFEVPISYSGRTYAEGKKIGWKDGIAAFWHIFRFNVLA